METFIIPKVSIKYFPFEYSNGFTVLETIQNAEYCFFEKKSRHAYKRAGFL